LAYLDIGADNGGIVLNISESGLAVHAVSVLPPDPVVDIRLQLPRSMKRLEAKAKVAWTSTTKKEAGVEFLNLAEEVRLEIKEWLATENIEPVYIETLRAPGASPASFSARKDKWTSLVSGLTSIPAGIDRVAGNRIAEDCVTSDNVASLLAETVVFSAPAGESAALPLEPAPLISNEVSVEAAPAHELTLSEALMADEKQPELKPKLALSGIADPLHAPSASIGVGDPSHSKSDPEFSLASDKLLNTPLRQIVLPGKRSNKSDATNGSRTLRDSPSRAAVEDDFLRKARALFGPTELTSLEPKPVDLAALAPAHDAPRILETPAKPQGAMPPPTSDLIATSSVVSEPVIHPVTTIPSSRANAHDKESSLRPTSASFRPPDLPGFLSILALCLLLSAICLVLGIVVGRNVAMRSHNIAARDNAPMQLSGQSAAVAHNGSSSSQPLPSASTLSGQNARKAERKSSPHAQTSHSQPTPQPHERSSEVSAHEPASEHASENESPTHSTQNRSPDVSGTPSSAASAIRVTSTATVSSNSSAPVSSSTATSHAAAPPDAGATQHPQPPADRLVPAYLIYRVQPIYPRSAIQLGIEGTVKIRATIARDGTVKNLKFVSGASVLSPAAIDAAQYWRYIPALRNGEPIETETDIDIEFRLPR